MRSTLFWTLTVIDRRWLSSSRVLRLFSKVSETSGGAEGSYMLQSANVITDWLWSTWSNALYHYNVLSKGSFIVHSHHKMGLSMRTEDPYWWLCAWCAQQLYRTVIVYHTGTKTDERTRTDVISCSTIRLIITIRFSTVYALHAPSATYMQPLKT